MGFTSLIRETAVMAIVSCGEEWPWISDRFEMSTTIANEEGCCYERFRDVSFPYRYGWANPVFIAKKHDLIGRIAITFIKIRLDYISYKKICMCTSTQKFHSNYPNLLCHNLQGSWECRVLPSSLLLLRTHGPLFWRRKEHRMVFLYHMVYWIVLICLTSFVECFLRSYQLGIRVLVLWSTYDDTATLQLFLGLLYKLSLFRSP